MSEIQTEWAGSQALQLIQSQGWSWKPATKPNILLNKCPYCGKEDHCHIELHGSSDEQKQRDGLFICMRCGRSGNLYSLKQHLGIATPDITSTSEWAADKKKIDPLPDVEECHKALMADAEALDYLVHIRGFSLDIIEKQKLGLTMHTFKETGKVRALVIPYLLNGNCIWAKYRTMPDATDLKKIPKAFAAPHGWDATLYNIEALQDGVKEITLVEGECNTIAGLDKGILDMCGVPGANVKKAEWIEKLNTVDKIYIFYDADKVGQKAAQDLAYRIGIEKCWKIKLPEFMVLTEAGIERKGKDLNEWFTQGGGTVEGYQRLKDEAILFDVEGVKNNSDALDEFEEELLERGASAKYTYPLFADLARFEDGDIIDLLGPEKQGKYLSVDSKILMEDGTWKRNGDLSVGDRLASVDGEESIVTGVFPQGLQELFRVTFWDGRSTLAGGPHLWKVQHVNKWEDGWRIYTTDAIKGEYHLANGSLKKKLYIPTISGRFGKTDLLPIDPYVMGVILGDGSITETGLVQIHGADQEIADIISDIGYNIKKDSAKYRYSITESPNLSKEISDLGLAGTICETKFIPDIYLQASREFRFALLQGLMDTDGTISNGQPSFTTISPQLAKDFQYLVRSLGGICKNQKLQKKKFRYKGELREGQPAYIFTVRFNERENLFRLTRKSKKALPHINMPRLTFTSIKSAGKMDSLCISVSHPSKLYVTDDFIVTHNTTVGLNMMEYMVDTYHENGVIICLEMRRARLVRKWICHKCGIEDNLPKNDCEKNALTQQFLDAIPRMKEAIANREGDLLFCYPNYETEEDIYKLIIDCIRRYGVKWIMVDNLQLICDTTLKGRNRTQHLSEISKRLAKIGKDYGCKIIRLLQPHRIADNKLATSDSVDGASQIAKDCDAMFVINRNKVGEISKEVFAQGGFIQTEGAFGPEMLVTAGLSRYSAGGSVTLYFNGATSTIHRLTDGKIAAMNAKANSNVGYARQLEAIGVTPATPTSTPTAIDNLRSVIGSTVNVSPVDTPEVPDEGAIII